MEFGATIKTEEAPDTSAAYVDIEIDLNHSKQKPGLVQPVESEMSMFVKKEFVENISEDDSEQQCDQGASTPAGTGNLYEENNPYQGDWVNVKPELEMIDIGPIVLQHMDIHYALNKSTVDGSNKAKRCNRVKKGVADKLKDSLTPHKAIKKERSRLLQSLQSSVHEDCLASLCRVHVVGLDIFQCDLCHVVYTEKLRLLHHLQTGHASPPRTSLIVQLRKTNKRNVSDSLAPQKAMTKEWNRLPLTTSEHQSASLCSVRVMRLDVFQCDLCHAVYKEKRRLLQHLQVVHACRPQKSFIVKFRKTNKRSAADDKIKCDYCGQITAVEDYNEAHLMSCLGQQKGLQQHLLPLHPTTSSNCFRCDECDKTFCKPHLLSAHRKLHERNSATSGATSSYVGGPSNVRRSEAAKAEPKPFKCDVCDKRYSTEATLTIHKRFHSGIGLSVCNYCSAKFNTKSNLVTHLRTHTGEKPYQCDTCNATFTTSGYLTKHKRFHTGEKPYQCDTCNARFTTSGDLTKHKRVHTGEKPYQCDTCNARFATSGDLTKHNRVHTGEKPYQCDTCDASFSQSSHLITHKRFHSGEKPYKCDTCNIRFTTSSHLITHKRFHSGEKPYQCNTCDASFSRSDNLITHKRVHSVEKPLKCTECGSKFTQKK